MTRKQWCNLLSSTKRSKSWTCPALPIDCRWFRMNKPQNCTSTIKVSRWRLITSTTTSSKTWKSENFSSKLKNAMIWGRGVASSALRGELSLGLVAGTRHRLRLARVPPRTKRPTNSAARHQTTHPTVPIWATFGSTLCSHCTRKWIRPIPNRALSNQFRQSSSKIFVYSLSGAKVRSGWPPIHGKGHWASIGMNLAIYSLIRQHLKTRGFAAMTRSHSEVRHFPRTLMMLTS